MRQMRASRLLAAAVAVLLLSLCAVVLFLLFEEARHARSVRRRADPSPPAQ